MNSKSISPLFTLFILTCFHSSAVSQQPYIGKATVNCKISSDNSSSALGYTCNGLNRTCQSYLIYRANPPYDTVSSISTLLSSDRSEVAAINSVPINTTFTTNKIVIVPINCSCSGDYYQKTASYIVRPRDNYYLIVNNTYHGLTTCKALKAQNDIETVDIYTGTNMTIPLRCACPTKNQTDKGVKYLLSYVVNSGDFVSRISVRFGVDTGRTLAANGLTEQSSTIYAYTTLLVPMKDPPSSLQTVSPPPRLSPPPPPPPPPRAASSGGGSGRTKWVFAAFGFLAGSAVVLAAGAVVLWVLFRSRKADTAMKNTKIVSETFEAIEKPEEQQDDEESRDFIIDKVSTIAQSIKLYDFEELRSATGDFGINALIKGSVYRGRLTDDDGGFIAIKRMDGDVLKEINILNKINHFNLIRLSGISFNDGTWYFVYEYAVNGSLTEWIHYENGGRMLSWTQRVQIAFDVATGLNYLHSFNRPSLVHKNVTSSNVLLDSDYRGKISNLSLARSAEGEDGHFDLTKHIVGTRGYMAPEYLENGLVSTKIDVYAFGVLVMEMITGKEVRALHSEENPSLVGLLNPVLSEDEVSKEAISDLIDPSLQNDFPHEIAVSVAGLIAACLSKNPGARPSMDEILPSMSRILTSSMSWEVSKNVSAH